MTDVHSVRLMEWTSIGVSHWWKKGWGLMNVFSTGWWASGYKSLHQLPPYGNNYFPSSPLPLPPCLHLLLSAKDMVGQCWRGCEMYCSVPRGCTSPVEMSQVRIPLTKVHLEEWPLNKCVCVCVKCVREFIHDVPKQKQSHSAAATVKQMCFQQTLKVHTIIHQMQWCGQRVPNTATVNDTSSSRVSVNGTTRECYGGP